MTLRLARLLIAADKPDEALGLLGDASRPAALEISGDAQLALGHADQARAAWSKALTGLAVGAPQRRLLELKLGAVGGPVKQSETKS